MENVMQVRNEYRKQQWAQIIRECQSNGLATGDTAGSREYRRKAIIIG